MHRSHSRFLALAFFCASQAFTVPLAAVGPWAIWPTLADLAVPLLLALHLLEAARGGRLARPSPAQAKLESLVLLAFVLGVLSHVFVPWVHELVGLSPALAESEARRSWGAFFVYRAAQNAILVHVATRLPLDASRRRSLGVVVLAAFAIACVSVVLTYTEVVEPALWASHLPRELGPTAGAWGTYVRGEIPGGGTIGYNHGYVACQVILLAGLALHLLEGRFADPVAAVTVAVCFLTESRAGLFSALLFAAALLSWRAILFLGAATLLALAVASERLRGFLAENERQMTTFRPHESENLSGRDDIWALHGAYLVGSPLRWLIGAGVGGSMLVGVNAHMLPLQFLTETGVIGLGLATAIGWTILAGLWRHERRPRPLAWATIALLVGAATQDTFYPAPAFVNFLGFFLVSVSLALGERDAR
jgi:hypothetical protein